MTNLTNEEIIKLAKEGDNEAYEYLFERNIRFPYIIVNRFNNYLKYTTIDELYSVALYAMIKAYNTYDLDKGFVFLTYASRVMHNEILIFGRKLKRYARYGYISIDEPIYSDMDEPSGLCLGDTLASDIESPETDFINIEEIITRNEILIYLLGTLNDVERKIIISKFYENKTQKQIAEETNFSQGGISRKYYNILKKLRQRYNDEFEEEYYNA